MKTPSCIMVHHSAVSYEKNADQFDANNRFHESLWSFKSSLGFYLGYNYEIAANGQVRQARRDGEQTAACYQARPRALFAKFISLFRPSETMNSGQCIHICLDGNFDQEKPRPEQIYALRDLLRSKCRKYGIPKNRIYFHGQFAAKTCPGKNMDAAWIQNLVG